MSQSNLNEVNCNVGLENKLERFARDSIRILLELDLSKEEDPYLRIVEKLVGWYNIRSEERWRIERIWRKIYQEIAVGDFGYRVVDVFSGVNKGGRRWSLLNKDVSVDEVCKLVIENERRRPYLHQFMNGIL